MTETESTTAAAQPTTTAVDRSERMALRSEIERLRRELDAIYESNTWRTGTLANRALSPALRLLRRRRIDERLVPPGSLPLEESGRAHERGPTHPLTEDLDRRSDYERLVAKSDFGKTAGRRTLFLTSTPDLDAGRGDLYVACGLGLALEERGFDVVISTADHERSGALTSRADYVVALVPDVPAHVFAVGTPVIAWVRNETDRWCRHSQLGKFAAVLASSSGAHAALETHFGGPLSVLAIGVDTKLFRGDPQTQRRGVASTVNQWGRERDVYRTLKRIPIDFDLEIHGTHLVLAEELRAMSEGSSSFFALPSLYRQTELILDDFNHTTLGYGSVNSRVFEALACGSLVATNGRVGLNDLGLGQLPVWSDPSTLRRVISDVLANPEWRHRRASELQAVVLDQHSYERRAQEFETAVDTMLSSQTGSRHVPIDTPPLDPSGERRPCELLYFPDYTATNPYQHMLYDALGTRNTTVAAAQDPFDLSMVDHAQDRGSDFVFHLHWTAPILGPSTGDVDAADRLTRFLAELDRVNDAGGKLIWTVHNVMPHECARPDLEVELRRELCRRADAIHVMSATTIDAVETLYALPHSKTTVVEHSSYSGIYPNSISRDEARSLLGIDADERVLLYLGGIRPYRGLDQLLDAFDAVAPSRSDLRLIVAGRPGRFPGVVELEDRCRSNRRVLPHFNPVPDDELQVFFQAADAAVLPYQHVLNSGSVMLSLTYGCPVIAPRLGALTDFLADSFSIGYDPSEPEGLEKALRDIDRVSSEEARRHALTMANAVVPHAMAEAFAQLVGKTTHSVW